MAAYALICASFGRLIAMWEQYDTRMGGINKELSSS